MESLFSADPAGPLAFAAVLLSAGFYFVRNAVIGGVKALPPRQTQPHPLDKNLYPLNRDL